MNSTWAARLDLTLAPEQFVTVSEEVYRQLGAFAAKPEESPWRRATSLEEIIDRISRNKVVLDASSDWVIAVRGELNASEQVAYGYVGAQEVVDGDQVVRRPNEDSYRSPSSYTMSMDALFMLKADDLVPVSNEEMDEAQALFLAALRGREERRATREA